MTMSLMTATAILTVGLVDDFRSRKFHNWLFVTCSVFALLAVASGLSGSGDWILRLGLALSGFAAGFVVFLPLVLMRIVGAGDMKLMAAFGLVAGWNAVLMVALYSLLWGAAFGVLQVALKGQLPAMVRNLGSMAINRGATAGELHKIPYTVALLTGWLTHLFFLGVV